MTRSELAAGCKEHPSNKQLPGVCSSCLRDKLSKLQNNKPTYRFLRSPPSSSNSPQPFSRRRHRRHTSNVADSMSSMMSFDYRLKSGNSIAFASRSLIMDREVNGNKKGKNGSFWSKILQLTRKNTKVAFMHSRTTREEKSWHF